MINVEKLITYLDKNQKSTFEDIWKANKQQYIKKFPKVDEFSIKADVHLAFKNDERIVLLFNSKGIQVWDLAKKYDFKTLTKLKSDILSEVFDKQLEESNETEETEEAAIFLEETSELEIIKEKNIKSIENE